MKVSYLSGLIFEIIYFIRCNSFVNLHTGTYLSKELIHFHNSDGLSHIFEPKSSISIISNKKVLPLSMNKSNRGNDRNRIFENSMNTVQEYYDEIPSLSEDPSLAEVITIIMAADSRKAQNISASRVSKLTVVTNFMVVLEGTSRPQNQAIAAKIMEEMELNHRRYVLQQGTPESGWILLDYGDIIVHIMTPKSRIYYDIDTFWNGGEKLNVDKFIVPNVVSTNADETLKSNLPIGSDPFWS